MSIGLVTSPKKVKPTDLPVRFDLGRFPGNGIDTLEHSLAASGAVVLANLGPDGYLVLAALAVDNMNNCLAVIVDCINLLTPLTIFGGERRRKLAECFCIEAFCSDLQEHRRRVEELQPDAFSIAPPTWREVEEREYHPWLDVALRLDTGVLTPEEAVELAL